MKNQILFIIMIGCSAALTVNAQCTITQGGFENWTVTTHTTIFSNVVNYEHIDDTNWICLDDLMDYTVFGSTSTPYMSKSTNAQAGSYAMKLESPAGKNIKVLGKENCSTRPAYVNGYFKYTGDSADELQIYAGFFKDDTIPVGSGHLFITKAENSYKAFSIPIAYFNSFTPDQINFIFDLRNNGSGTIEAYIDNITTSSTATTIDESESFNDIVSIYPNPARDQIRLNVDGYEQVQQIEIIDSRGRIVKQVQNIHVGTSITIQDLQKGVYFLRTQTENGLFANQFIKN